MFEFENFTINGIYATRFIASWLKEGGKLKNGSDLALFRTWLRTLKLSNEEVDRISFLVTNGKLELEMSAQDFLEENDK